MTADTAEREAFEKWAYDQWQNSRPPDNAWLGWQARAALPARAPEGWTLADLHRANAARQEEWCPDQKPDLSFRGNELAGEIGEACNVIKKLERERLGWAGSRDTLEHLAEELADGIMCIDLVANAAGISGDALMAAVVQKFNATSQARGFKTMLSASPPPPEQGGEPAVKYTCTTSTAMAKMLATYKYQTPKIGSEGQPYRAPTTEPLASPAPGPDEPVVRALEWNPYRAETPFGYYLVEDQTDLPERVLNGRAPFLLSGTRLDYSRHATLKAARAAAQADYERRILSALQPAQPAPAPVAAQPQPSAWPAALAMRERCGAVLASHIEGRKAAQDKALMCGRTAEAKAQTAALNALSMALEAILALPLDGEG
ncbi:MazG-like family protein [Xanthobacter tagetidis]|uniref:NTP pyrophosphohydrolase MazG putative catalytic core domain-containing protein n=1 Tax=Xanthobacter tagetidis TaxID=60216 RepID=A0A3L7AIL7_9HYPH|nr:MazG-like family protein [Xanthobacter tagetidis]MBB6306286.1 NTP pyrophosphatase (non-canonical NTP hydrolase) [Xanthobacter tagetidis]RLP79560.1 hypothetical protein D9R14_07810 [Xanthobacter tagetidis]